MSGIQDVPRILEIEGKEILAIPTRIESELRQAILHCGQGSHGRSDGGDNVQIPERAVCVSKEQMVSLAENGMGELQKGVDHAERQIEEEKWRVFVENIKGCLMNQITEKVYELRTMFNEDVQIKRDTARELYRVDIKEIMSRMCDSHQNLDNNIRDVVTEVGNQLTKNNDRNNQQEDALRALGGAIIGLRIELVENRINNQKLQENQGIMEKTK